MGEVLQRVSADVKDFVLDGDGAAANGVPPESLVRACALMEQPEVTKAVASIASAVAHGAAVGASAGARGRGDGGARDTDASSRRVRVDVGRRRRERGVRRFAPRARSARLSRRPEARAAIAGPVRATLRARAVRARVSRASDGDEREGCRAAASRGDAVDAAVAASAVER